MDVMAKSGCRHLAVLLALFAAAPTQAAPGDRAVCPARTSDEYYFQRGSLRAGNAKSDDFVRGWYSEQLAAMGEPSLSCGSPGEAYRFTWLRTFHHPVAVRVQVAGGRATLHASELDGAGGYAPGHVLRRLDKVLDAADFADLKRTFDESGLASLPTSVASYGFDGSEWIVETAGPGGYHLVVRWTPEDGPVRSVGLLLLGLTGWRLDDVY